MDIENAIGTIAVDDGKHARGLRLDGDRIGDIQIAGGRILAGTMQAEHVGAARHHDDICSGMGIGRLDRGAKVQKLVLPLPAQTPSPGLGSA